jgi:hypothetical protein
VILALVPRAFILTAIREGEYAESVRVSGLPISLVARSIWVDYYSNSFWIPVL